MDNSAAARLPLRKWLPFAVLSLAALVAAGLLLASVSRQSPVDDSPKPFVVVDPSSLPFASPYKNVQKGVKYVGDKACVGCHKGLARTYHNHPMGRSFAPVSEASPLESYDAKANTPFDALNLRLSVERRGDRVFHKVIYKGPDGRPVPGVEQEAEVQYAMGSGTQGRTYILNHDGFLFESPISWFSRKKAWDLSPGYAHNFQHFTRPIATQCLFCHCNEVSPVKGSVNHYDSPLFRGYTIGCERCHGPGELHVERRRRGVEVTDTDDTIVNPRRLEPALREAVCQQCHLQGAAAVERRGRSFFDYRPGMPLHEVVSVFVKPPAQSDSYKAVSHVEQMYISRCFVASGGKLGCISCHDPHAHPKPAERVSFYRGSAKGRGCLSCHTEKSCHLSPVERRARNQADSCIDCHMPPGPTADVAHAALTDHRILRRPDQPPRIDRQPEQSEGLLVHFHRDLVPGHDPEMQRDLALAMLTYTQGMADEAASMMAAELAEPLLARGVARHPRDAAAWEGRGYSLWLMDRRHDALRAVAEALALSPNAESALPLAGQIAAELGQLDNALSYARRLVSVNPWNTNSHMQLATVHVKREEWPQAQAAAGEALRLHPANVPARLLLVECHAHLGRPKEARAEFNRVLALDPASKADLERWFDQLPK
jgi:hypothetical protein